MYRRKGFTLIELLIVVAIIAILALIAVPNFLEAQVRAKVARVQNDMRALATGLESYRVDWNGVPHYDSWQGQGQNQRNLLTPGYFWRMLTSPVPYINSAFVDAFVKIGTHSQSSHVGDSDLLDPFIQVGTGHMGTSDTGPYGPVTRDLWCAVSYGPDSADDTSPLGAYPFCREACPYDPTNGTASWGDIYRFDGRVPRNFLSSANPVNYGQGQGDPY